MGIAEVIRDRDQMIYDANDKVRAALYAAGWKCSSALPGSLWLWSKSFPESKTQFRWEGRGEDRRKVPHPPFTINGAPLETALQIEASWQELWDDNKNGRPWPKDEEGHDVDPADMSPEDRAFWEGATQEQPTQKHYVAAPEVKRTHSG